MEWRVASGTQDPLRAECLAVAERGPLPGMIGADTRLTSRRADAWPHWMGPRACRIGGQGREERILLVASVIRLSAGGLVPAATHIHHEHAHIIWFHAPM